jgi:hypothetical protein
MQPCQIASCVAAFALFLSAETSASAQGTEQAASGLHTGCVSALRRLHAGRRSHHRLPPGQRTAAEQALL